MKPQDYSSREGVSAITWIVGEGHVPLEDARRHDLERLERLELELDEADGELARAHAAMNEAKRARDRAYEKRQKARGAVKDARESLLLRLPEPPEEL